MIYVVGDTHCPHDIKKLNNKEVYKACGDKYPDYVIICGDAGFIWDNNPEDATEQYWLNWITDKPWTTLFVDGNHENHYRLNKLPLVNMFGSEVGQVTDKLFHLKRGYCYVIEEKKFFCMGGAKSTDQQYRQAYIDWWPEEVPSYADYLKGLETLKNLFSVDYVISHTAPESVMKKLFSYSDRYKDSTCAMLESFKKDLCYSKHFFGHMHEDINDGKHYCLFEKGWVIE